MSDARPKITLKQHGYDAQITLDGELIDIVIARFAGAQFNDFMDGYARLVDPPNRRPLQIRHEGEEQETHLVPAAATPEEQERIDRLPAYKALIDTLRVATGELGVITDGEVARASEMYADLEALVARPKQTEDFVISGAEVARRRLDEMSPAERDEWLKKKRDDDRFVTEFCAEAISAYVSILPGQIAVQDNDGDMAFITTGARFVDYFGNRPGLLTNIVHTIYAENTLSPALKNALRSHSASRRSSSTPQTTAVGARQEPTAVSAESAASADLEAATASSAPIPSGSMVSSK